MDVGDWLRSLGMGQFEAAFRDNEIDSEVLSKLTNDDLKELGVAAVGQRRKLLSAIESLAAALTPPTAAPNSPPPLADSVARPARTLPAITESAERRHLTVMFCDLVGSTSISAKLDAEDWRDLVGGYLDAASAAVTGMGGHVAKKLGDGIMALFGYTLAQENDAERAVRAALAIQRALAEINRRNAGVGRPELMARIGVETGAVVVDSTGEIFGDAPNVAARVQALAEPGAIWITAKVQRQVAGLFVAEDRGAQALKGVPEPIVLYRIVRASGGGRRSGQRALTPLVGRDEEVAMLLRRWERARQGEGQFVTIVGEPGLGKSRLIEEFRARLVDTPHTAVEWSSSQLLQNTPLHPIAEWGRNRFGAADVPAERRLADLETTLQHNKLDPAEYVPLLAPLVDIPLVAERASRLAPEELRRRQMAALLAWVAAGARVQPVMLAFEDLHWADPTTLDLMRGFAERGALAPLFVVATARPEFRAPWGARSHHGAITLSPLDRRQVVRMVAELAAKHALSRDIIDGVSERTGGVPLFIEEVTRLLLERGEQGGAQAIPPTLQQSLTARLDRLGSAREVAMIGAVLGRGFSYPLLRAIAGMDEAPLQQALEKLAEADILLVEGLPPDADYRFKHALIQDAAYENLLKSRRQALHRRVAETLRDQFPDRASAQPEVLAHHFTQAGLIEAAVEYWGVAGDQALRRSAFQEAIAHLGKAIEMADKPAAGATRGAVGPALAMRLHTTFGNALIAVRGYQAPETMAAFQRAGELAVTSADPIERASAYYGLWAGNYVRAELGRMDGIVNALLQEADNSPNAAQTGIAHRVAGTTRWFEGRFAEARTHFQRSISLFDPERDRDLAYRFGADVGVTLTGYLAFALAPMGEAAEASVQISQMLARADKLENVATRVWALGEAALIWMSCWNTDAVAAVAEPGVRLATDHGMKMWASLTGFAKAWSQWRKDRDDTRLIEMRDILAELQTQDIRIYSPLFWTALADAEREIGDAQAALHSVDIALELASASGQRWFEAESWRVKGAILSDPNCCDADRAEAAFTRAREIAARQGSRAYELSAALALAKLQRADGRPLEAHDVLASALVGFTPTSEMPEIAEAQALLAALEETNEVKVDAAQRRRMTHLRVAYGNALFATRGYSAAETEEAFAKARESAYGDKDAPARLAVDYGLWVASYLRGELPQARARAAAFLSDVEPRPDSPEASVAHRILGTTHWFAGEYLEARDHGERALALFQPGRDDDLAFRFGHDAGVAAMLFLALALWPLGDVERAISLVGAAEARTAALAQAQTHAFGKWHTALFELMRGDLTRTTPNAVELARLAHTHDLPMWRALGGFFQGLAMAESGAPGGGLEDMRRGAELLREQNFLIFDGLFKIALAEAEARAGDLGRAVAILDEALTSSERTGHRAFDAELYRARGEMLLTRDPANPAPAEEAFRTAIAVAKQQGTRSFELRAALGLAKLYLSTGRSVEAHDILAPALEGFEPTPEMAETAEAQALLAACAQGRPSSLG
jgi:class 3 adenylate cyclase/tetratricopeptide (TPR) repeat protein